MLISIRTWSNQSLFCDKADDASNDDEIFLLNRLTALWCFMFVVDFLRIYVPGPQRRTAQRECGVK